MNSRTRVNFFGCLTLLLLGAYIAAYQSAIPQLAREYGLSPAESGRMIGLHFWGSLLFPLLLGRMADRRGPRPLLLLCFGLFGAGVAAILLSRRQEVLLAALFVIGGSFAVLEGGVSGLLAAANPGGEERLVNLSQMCFCFGAVASPLAIGGLGLSFRQFCGGAFAALAAGMALLARLPLPVPAGPGKEGRKAASLWRSGFFLAAVLAMGLYVGVEEGIVFWAGSLAEAKGLDGSLTGALVSAYWLGMGLSRLLSSLGRRRLRPAALAGLTGAALLLAATILTGSGAVLLACYFLLGAAVGPVWAYLMATAAKRFPGTLHQASGGMIAAGAAGGSVAPILLGLAGEAWGAAASFGLLLLAVPVVLALTIRLKEESP